MINGFVCDEVPGGFSSQINAIMAAAVMLRVEAKRKWLRGR
jgi:hypothetical protein